MGRFKSMGKKFKDSFDEAIKENILPELNDEVNKAYLAVESEVEDLIDSGRIKINRDVTAKQVFTKMGD